MSQPPREWRDPSTGNVSEGLFFDSSSESDLAIKSERTSNRESQLEHPAATIDYASAPSLARHIENLTARLLESDQMARREHRLLIEHLQGRGNTSEVPTPSTRSLQLELQGAAPPVQSERYSTGHRPTEHFGSLGQKLLSTEEELARTKRELAEARTALGSRQTVGSMQDTLKGVQKDLEETRRRLAVTRDDWVRVQDKLFSTQEDLASTCVDLAATQRDLAQSQEELEDSRGELIATKEQLAASQRELAFAHGNLAQAEKKFDTRLWLQDAIQTEKPERLPMEQMLHLLFLKKRYGRQIVRADTGTVYLWPARSDPLRVQFTEPFWRRPKVALWMMKSIEGSVPGFVVLPCADREGFTITYEKKNKGLWVGKNAPWRMEWIAIGELTRQKAVPVTQMQEENEKAKTKRKAKLSKESGSKTEEPKQKSESKKKKPEKKSESKTKKPKEKSESKTKKPKEKSETKTKKPKEKSETKTKEPTKESRSKANKPTRESKSKAKRPTRWPRSKTSKFNGDNGARKSKRLRLKQKRQEKALKRAGKGSE